MSPACNATFEGDNGGDIGQGVTADEIRIVVYVDAGTYTSPADGAIEQSPDPGTICDVDAAPGQSCPGFGGDRDPLMVRVARAMSLYFNARFQTYDRLVHYWVYWGPRARGEQSRRADAAAIQAIIHPFAVVDEAWLHGDNASFQEALASRDVPSFSLASLGLPSDFYAGSVMWSFWPDAEHWADSYSSYVCTKVAREPDGSAGMVKHSGTISDNGKPRKFGLMYTTDPSHGELLHARTIMKNHLTACGVQWETEVTFPIVGPTTNTLAGKAYAFENAHELRSKNVTTVLWLGGLETQTSGAAEALAYFPEWVFAGDMKLDAYGSARLQGRKAWASAWGVSAPLRRRELQSEFGWKAYWEAEPNGSAADARYAARAYRDHFFLFYALQVTGPNLTSGNLDTAFHAIPPSVSTDPDAAAFFFDQGDHTGVKDMQEVWWDPLGTPPGDVPAGCYRTVGGGRRFRAGFWETGDNAFVNPNDPCTAFDSSDSVVSGAARP